MRARYYEPASGRFISEDPDRCDRNWVSYCRSDPLNSVDGSGKDGLDARDMTELIFKFLKNFGLDPTCMKIAGVALVLAALIATVAKCQGMIAGGYDLIAMGSGHAMGGGVAGLVGLGGCAVGAFGCILGTAMMGMAFYEAALEINVIENDAGD